MTPQFPDETADATVWGRYRLSGTFVQDNGDGTGLYYFPDDAILGNGWEASLTPEEAADPASMQELIDDHYGRREGRRCGPPRRHLKVLR